MSARKFFPEPGQRFARLTVLREIPAEPGSRARLECRCDCGAVVTLRRDALPSGNTKSCGCLARELSAAALTRLNKSERSRERVRQLNQTPEHRALVGRAHAGQVPHNHSHGLSKHPLYGAWAAMMRRCTDPRARGYRDYGGRGITVCPEWRDVTAFITWIEANLGPRPDGMTLDRRDNDGNYEPGNVRWATREQQVANSRPKRPRGSQS